jgi:hypothetical protein
MKNPKHHHPQGSGSQPSLLRPAIAPTKGGLLIIGHDGSRMTVADSEVEQWIEDLKEVRRQQLIRDCRRIAGCSDLSVVENGEVG